MKPITQIPSPNFWSGRRGYKPTKVVIHIMDGSLAGTDMWFFNTASNVSAHYGIGLNGDVHQYVQEEDSAWANATVGAPVNQNLYTISIEHEGHDLAQGTSAQWDASADLIQDICARWNIPLDREHIIGHYEIDPVRKPNCPTPDRDFLNKLVNMAIIKRSQVGILQQLINWFKGRINTNTKQTKQMKRILEVSEAVFHPNTGHTTMEFTRYNVNDDASIEVKSYQHRVVVGNFATPDEAIAYGKSQIDPEMVDEVVYAEHQLPQVMEIMVRDFGPNAAKFKAELDAAQ